MSTELPAGQRHGIKETKDIAAAIAATMAAIQEAKKDDGKVGKMEALGFLRLAPELFTAIIGAGNVREELRDISAEEMDEMLGEFVQRGVIPENPEKRDRLDIILRITHGIIRGMNEWENIGKPPVAEEVAA